ncbi:nitrous oxide reductase family maturation protein NosD [Fodinibius salsisoli]|uniref:Nitrous oxide reductase family maturation protein NosD n=1 Tax=Fodinibius salsisoli TaxID=2820877 RepID=A0ABT3PN06_9BACT|nr:nitrous oxide reductase family maturation protein NosD [Fodinibius salsisoli]MCW9707315.1 nitrous oxide reductase family maturation protein NosD [Fodinibius salsisoli]
MWTRFRQIFFLVLMMTAVQAAKGQSIRVSPDGTVNTLEQALALADSNDVIRLQEGRYLERNIVIDKPVTIEGERNAVVDAEGEGFVLIVRADNVTLRNFEVQNAGISFMDDNAGILVEEAKGVLIENLTLTDNFFGIYLSKASDSTIRNNTLIASGERETQSGNGIHLWYSKNITIHNNTIKGHRDGIYFEFVEGIAITDNLSEENLRYGQHFMFSDHCTFTGNTFKNNGAGVAVMYTDHVTMTGNRFEHNWGSAAYGLLMKEIRESKVYNNTFENNSVGMYMEASSRNRVKHNDFINNGWALKVMANSMDNQFVQNNFIENSFEVSTNSRQNFNIFTGNYWSRYMGYDLDRDGVGDVPHHPVRLFSVLIEKQPEMLILMRSLLIGMLDTAERIMPVLTPEELIDKKPQMARIQ